MRIPTTLRLLRHALAVAAMPTLALAVNDEEVVH